MESISGLKWKEKTKIVIGIDIGTTQSAVAIGLLEQGVDVRKALHTVTEWPGQGLKQAKIPTAVWYDVKREVPRAMSFGADTTSFETEDKAQEQGWVLVRNFKLHLHPVELRARHNVHPDDPLPARLSLEQVYTDFLKYLFANTESYFKDRILQGDALWSRCRHEMEFVIAHPNVWSTKEQAFLRKVAIKAGLVKESNAKQVQFVTEAEASVHYCLDNSTLMDHFEPGTNFAVCDAGGSTVDITLYTVASKSPLFKIEERNIPGCVQAGGIFVDREAGAYMRKLLGDARLSHDDIKIHYDKGMRDFEARAKRTFSNRQKEYNIEVGDTRFSAPAALVRRGMMVVPNKDMKLFFDVCMDKIFTKMDELIKGVKVSDALLVGGFGDSPYLRDEFKNRYKQQGCQVTLVDSFTSKAVAEGIVIWSYSQAVVSRRPHSTFGSSCAITRDLSNPEHIGRGFYLGLDGYERVAGRWETIVVKGVPLQVTSVNRSSFVRLYSSSAPYLGDFQDTIEAFSGENAPYWSRNNDGSFRPGFRTECKVTANLQKLSGALKIRIGQNGKICWALEFDLCIRFGGVELEGFIEWEEDGIKREGPVTIIPDIPLDL